MPTVTEQRSERRSARRTADVTGHVLLADGDVAAREPVESELQRAGLRVSLARTGFEAIVKATCHLPDLILLDENLPDMGAAETARLIATCPVTSHIPILRMRSGRRLPRGVFKQLRRRAI